MNKIDQQQLYAFCVHKYQLGGQQEVFDYILEHHHEQPWKYCEPCESSSPVTIEDQPVCLVCGSLV